jgi:pyruvate formate lyase activating enzyme
MAGAKIGFTQPIMKPGEHERPEEYWRRVEGVIFDIQRYSLHDGPGLRTCIFFKGCPLRCKWCSNPESQNIQPELAVFTGQCIRCGQFEQSCPDIWRSKRNISWGSLVFGEFIRRATVCPAGGVRWIGERRLAADVIAEVQRDAPFYLEDGGLTLTGGEPLFQSEMAEAILRLAKTESLSTAMETCGYTHWPNLERLLPYLDRILFDLKHINKAVHLAGTGKSNELILVNLRRLLAWPVKVTIRIPLIPGFNASKQSLEEMAGFLAGLKGSIAGVDFLPYHTLGKTKYAALRRSFSWDGIERLSSEQVVEYAEIFKAHDFEVNIGG